MNGSRLMTDFSRYLALVPAVAPTMSYQDLESVWSRQGELVATILDGGSKRDFLAGCRQLEREREWQLNKRNFYVATLEELEWCLRFYTDDSSYARSQRCHEGEHGKLFAGFAPTDQKDHTFCVIYSVLILTTGVIVPYTVICKRIGRLTPVVSCQKNPDALFDFWSEQTIREFYLYLRNGVSGGSKGDRLILRN